jgi:DNA invertase Pin-like site-specific DNA recombinase
MLTVLGGLAEFERELIRARGEGRGRAMARGQSLGRPFKLIPREHSEAIRRRDRGRTAQRHRPQLQRQPKHDFTADGVMSVLSSLLLCPSCLSLLR